MARRVDTLKPTIDWVLSWVLRLIATGGMATEIWADKFRNGEVLIPLATLAGLPDFLGLYRMMRRAVQEDRRIIERDYRRVTSMRPSERFDERDSATNGS